MWTWSDMKDYPVLLRPKNPDNPFQKFDVTTTFGEGLISFKGLKNEKKIIRFKDTKLCMSDIRSGVVEEFDKCPEAPNFDTFLVFQTSKFYWSLNHMANSLRLDNEDEKSIRHDDLLKDIFSKCTRGLTSYKEKDEEILFAQISSYCLAIILKGYFQTLINETNFTFSDLIIALRQKQKIFIDHLDPSNHFNQRHKPIPPEKYKAFLDNFKRHLQNNYISERPDDILGAIVLLSIIDIDGPDPNFSNYGPKPHKRESAYKPLFDQIFSLLGGTGKIVNDCLTPFETSNSDSGHMAIIRVKEKGYGRRFKQSLYIAKIVSGLYNLEIMQDFHGNSTALNQQVQEAKKAAEATNTPEALRILRRIQPLQCQKLNSKGEKCCKCDLSQSKDVIRDDLECPKCKHIHLVFSSYEDLIRLPCLLILINNGRMGDTFPESFIGMDDRAYNLTKARSNTYLSAFAQEKGRLCRYTTMESKKPYVYVGKGLYDQLMGALKFSCSYYKSFIPDKIDQKVVFNKARHTLEPKKKHADAGKIDKNKKRNNHFLLSAEPQCGKTGVYLHLIALLRLFISNRHKSYHIASEEVELDLSDDEDEIYETDEIETDENQIDFKTIDMFKATVPYWKYVKETLAPLPKEILTRSKYGNYRYPMECPPYFSNKKVISKKSTSIEVVNHEFSTHKGSHKCHLCIRSDDMDHTFIKHKFPIIGSIPALWHYINLFQKEKHNKSLVHIMTPSFRRATVARLNWNHLMLTEIKDSKKKVVPFIHVVFVRSSDYEEYKKVWGGYLAIVKLPETMDDIDETVHNGGIGFARRFIQRFAHVFNIDRFFLSDDSILYLKQGISSSTNSGLQMEHIRLLKLNNYLSQLGNDYHEVPKEHRHFERHPHSEPNSIKTLAYSGPFSSFGIIGFRICRRTHRNFNSYFAKKHCCCLVYLNNKALVNNEIFYKPWKAKEDLVLCNDADKCGLTVLKFNLFEVFKVNIKSQFDNLLYKWTDCDVMGGGLRPYHQFNREEVVKKMSTYLHTLRIKSIREKEIPDFLLGIKELKSDIHATSLYLLKDFTSLLDVFDLEDIFFKPQARLENKTVVIEMDKVAFLNDLNGIKELLEKQMRLTNFSLEVFSISKPRMSGDYLVIHIFETEETNSVQSESLKRRKELAYESEDEEVALARWELEQDETKDIKFPIANSEPMVNPSPQKKRKGSGSPKALTNTTAEKDIAPSTSNTSTEMEVQNIYFIKRPNGMFDQVKDENLVLTNAQALAKICEENPGVKIEDFFKTPNAKPSSETVKQIKMAEMKFAGKS